MSHQDPFTKANVSAIIEGFTPITRSICEYCLQCRDSSEMIHHTEDCIYRMVNSVYAEVAIFWPIFPIRGTSGGSLNYTTFNDYYGQA